MTTPSAPRDVICLGTDRTSPLESSVKQIVKTLHRRGSRVLWLNPLPVRFPDTKKPDFWKKVQSKARTHSRFLRREGERMQVYSPLYLPVFNGFGRQVNRLAVSVQVAALRTVLGMRRPLVIASEFTTWSALPALTGLPVFFHFADKISAFREVSTHPGKRRILEDMERTLVHRCQLAGCSSRAIHEHVLAVAGDQAEKILYLPHGVDLQAFAGAGSTPCPPELADIQGPIAGYFGSLTQTNDKESFEHAARSLPDWTFVFIGRVAGDYSTLEALPNVRFLGGRPHAEIPAYGARFDVCFMGWKPHEWIENCFPLKTLEYLALAKPTVCTGSIAELKREFPGLVRFETTPEAFVDALREELADDDDGRRAARRAAAARFTWDHYVDAVLEGLARRGASWR